MSLKVTLIGGPTTLLELGGLRIIVDPTFDSPQTFTGAGTEGTNGITKTASPAFGADEVPDVDVALISHDHHIDNLDYSGREFLGRANEVFTTSEGAERLGDGAVGLESYESKTVALPDGGELTITGVPAHHGPEGVWQAAGPVTGFVLSADSLPTVYVSGDNASTEIVREIVERTGKIDVAVLFTGGASFEEIADGAYLTLTNEDAVQAAKILDAATVIPVHTDSWEHFTQSVEALERDFEAEGLAERTVIVRPGQSAEVGA